MKHSVILLLASLLSFNHLSAQIQTPVTWQYRASAKEVKAGETIDLIFQADIQADWYLYSSDFNPDLGPQVTTFAFTPSDAFQLVGKIKPIHAKKKYDPLWEGEYTYFVDKAEFRQTIKVLKTVPSITGSISYQTCSESEGKCIPGEEEFTFSTITAKGVAQAVPTTTPATTPSTTTTTPIQSGTDVSQASTDTSAQQAVAAATPGVSTKPESPKTTVQSDTKVSGAAVSGASKEEEEESLGGFLLLAFFSGFIALAMPCVYPLIPMTVSFFTGQGGSRKKGITNAVVYGFSIIIIYTLIGTITSLLFGSAMPYELSSGWVLNIIFFVVLVVFGLSFLGLFEIVLPSSLVNRVDKEADKGGFYGIFFMAFTLAIVSFSCTGPIAGSLLVLASKGISLKATLGMIAYSSAFAIPFTLFAIFPAWLKNMPKSGGWMNTIKVFLGFLELALAFKFLSNVDLAYHWGILDRDVFLSIWIAVFAALGLYLMGVITLPHDSKPERIAIPRLLMAMLVWALVVYLIPGLFGAPLKPLAGLLPPQTTQDFSLQPTAAAPVPTDGFPTNRKYADFLKLPHNLSGFFDLEEGLAYAKKVNKPVMIDFTGHSCANCRKMEEYVWSDPQVLKRLSTDYVLISLYVDDKTSLPENEWITGVDGKTKKTIGAKNFEYEINRFNSNAQPLYVLLDVHGNPLPIPTQAANYNVDEFVKFLDNGLDTFRKSTPVAVDGSVDTVLKEGKE